MERQSAPNNTNAAQLQFDAPITDAIISADNTTAEMKRLLQQFQFPALSDLLSGLAGSAGKKSFLVFKNNKYVSVPTENIALFHIKYDSPMILCFDKQEYFVNYSLEQIQNSLPGKQFFRLNRQYLINFNAIKEVEHYFARKLLVNPVVQIQEKLIVSRDKVRAFLNWLDNR